MAKGDKQNSQNTINAQGNQAQTHINQLLQNTLQPQNLGFQQNYNTGVGANLGAYGSGMQGYQTFLGGGNPGQQQQGFGSSNLGLTGKDPNFTPTPLTGDPGKDAIINVYNKYGVTPGAEGSGLSDLSYWSKVGNDPQYAAGRLESDLKGSGPDSGGTSSGSAIGGWQNAAQTGLLTDQQKEDLRARAIAPTRAVYQNAQNNIDRQRALTGGFSPNYTAASAKIARDQSDAATTASQNANAGIVGMQQQGQLAGLQGLTGAQLGALAGQTGLYGATPGLANTFGNQTLGSSGQLVNMSALQNQLGLGLMGAQNANAQIPSNFQSGLGNLSSLLGLAGSGANLLSGLGGMGGGGGSNFGSSNPGVTGDPSTGYGSGFLPSYDPYGGGLGGYGPDPSMGTGIGPGMSGFYA